MSTSPVFNPLKPVMSFKEMSVLLNVSPGQAEYATELAIKAFRTEFEKRYKTEDVIG